MSGATQFRDVNPWRQTYWDWRAVGNFAGGGTGSGFLVAAALAGLMGAPVRALAFVGLAFVGIGLTCVWLEIGRPWRAINVFFNGRTSWMSREAIVAPVLFATGGLAFLLGESLLLVPAALLGVGFLYCQSRILHASKGIPAWRQDEIIPLILASGFAEGFGVFLMVAPLAIGAPSVWAAVLLLALLAARFLALRAYGAKITGGAAPKASVKALTAALPAVRLIGHAVPAALLVLGLALEGTLQALCFGLAGLAAVGAGWWLKFTIIVAAAYTQGYAVARAPVRGAGTSAPGGAPGW